MATYARVEATGTVEQINPQGIKVDGFWWNPSKRVAVDLSRFAVGDRVYVEGDETADGQRRWIVTLDFADGYQRPANPAATVYEPDPDDLPDSPARQTRAQQSAPQAGSLTADRIACLTVAVAALSPWWAKKGEQPDAAILAGFAESLVDYLGQPRHPRA